MYREVVDARNLIQDALKELNDMISSLRKPNPDDLTVIISKLERATNMLVQAREKSVKQTNQEFFHEQLEQLLRGIRSADRKNP